VCIELHEALGQPELGLNGRPKGCLQLDPRGLPQGFCADQAPHPHQWEGSCPGPLTSSGKPKRVCTTASWSTASWWASRTSPRGARRKLHSRTPEPLFLVEWKDWPNSASWTRAPYENLGEFKPSLMPSRPSGWPRASPGRPQRPLRKCNEKVSQ